jgi:hypothetical protein
MPSVLFAGGRLDSLIIVAGAPTEVTTAGSFDATYCDASVLHAGVSGVAVTQATFLDASNSPVNLTSGQTGYVHFEHYGNLSASTAGTNLMMLVDSSGQPWLALRGILAVGAVGLFYNSGTGASPVWTQIGASTFTTGGARYAHDIKITLGSPHAVEWSVGGSLVQSGTFTQASLTTLRGAQFTNIYSGTGNSYYSQILCAEGRSTVNGKVKYSRATAAGGNSGWTGAYTDVNEAINSDTSFNSATSAGLRQTYAMGDVTVPVGYSIQTVMQFLRAKNDGAVPANIKSSVRQSTTNYDYASNMSGIGTSFAPLCARYDADPSTSAAWTQSGFNSAEFGFLSVT